MRLQGWKKAAGYTALGLVAVTLLVAGYWYATRPVILFVGFPDMYRFLLAEGSKNTGIRYDYWNREKADDPKAGKLDLQRYKAIYVSGRRMEPLTAPLKAALLKAQEAGSTVIVLPPDAAGRLEVGNADFEGREKPVTEYWNYSGPENIARFLRFTAAVHAGKRMEVEPPVPTPEDGYYHPDSTEMFTTTDRYMDWYRRSGKWREGAPKAYLDFANGWKLGMTAGTDVLIRTFESRGFNVAATFGGEKTASYAREFQPDILISRKHGRWYAGPAGVEILEKQIDAPLMRGMSLLFTGETFGQYRETRNGVRGAGLAMGAIVPEMDGAIEPTLIEGLDAEWYGRRFEAVEQDRVDRMADRALRWVRLRKAPNRDKRVAIVYVAGIGKGKITAASLNVPRSMIRFLSAMRQEGYQVSNLPHDAGRLLSEMLEKGRNVAESQQGELEKLSRMPDVELIPAAQYEEWFGSLPEKMRQEVMEAHGPPPGRFMTVEREGARWFVVPKLDFGNVIVLPQPARGANMDAKLQHNDRVPPPHQYLAVYFWLQKKWQADAVVNYGTHGTHEFLPGRPLGQLSDDWSDRTLGLMPNVYVYVMDNVGEALIAKRRGSAVTVDYQIPPIAAAQLTEADRKAGELYRLTEQFGTQDGGALQERIRAQIGRLAHEQQFDKDLGKDWSQTLPEDRDVEELQLHIHLINEDKVPLGLHTHSEVNAPEEMAPLVTQMLGKPVVERVARMELGFNGDRGETWERAKNLTVQRVRETLAGQSRSGALGPDLEKIRTFQAALSGTEKEIPQTLRALSGRYIRPGGGGDPVRNPQALPTARNLYGINPAEVPTRAAWEIGVKLADELLAEERKRLGRWPRRVGFTLWNTELIRHYGTDLAQILYLIGVRPVWDGQGVVADLELIPARELKRPRVDVVIQAASLFRDTFPDRMEFLDKAVRLVLEAGDGDNYVAEEAANMEQGLKEAGFSPKDARQFSAARVFSNAPGGYGTGVIDGIEKSGTYDSTSEITGEYLGRTGAVYTAGAEWGRLIPGLYKQALDRVDSVALSRSTNVISALTLDHYFEYLGGMTMAVREITGKSPETYVADVRDADRPEMLTAKEALTRDLRGKFWNPRWVKEQQAEGFSGAVEIAQTTTNLFGWQVTKPEAIGSYIWDEVEQVYVQDSLSVGIREWFDSANPYAEQNVTAILLEAARKGYWDATAEQLERVARRYAESVVKHGPAGDPRTVDNQNMEAFLTRALEAPGTTEAHQLSQSYKQALMASSSLAGTTVSGRKLKREAETGNQESPSIDAYSPWMLGGVLVLVAALFAGTRRKSRADR